jgi:fumarate reductase subunit C
MSETQRVDLKKKYYRRWMLRAPLGLVMVGFGLCLVAEAALYKATDPPTLSWVGFGTLALIVFNSGLCIFGDAILQRMRYERLEKS